MKNEVILAGIVLLFFIGGLFLLTKSSMTKKNDTPAIQKNSANVLSESTNVLTGNTNESNTQASPAQATELFDKSKTYTAVLKTTEGDITIQLNAQQTPNTVENFVTLARKNFYNNTIFHRVIKDFMIQGGDPKGDGTGGPGYRFADEPFEGEYTKGTIAMANAGPDTNGSQFFIMHKDYALPKNYVIFGKTVDGLDVVDKIAEAPVETSASGEPSKPVNPVIVQSVEIIEE